MHRRFVESAGFGADRFRLERADELVIEVMVPLEQSILADPNVWDLVRGPGGLRKIRLGQRAVARDKRGGVQCITWIYTHLIAIFGKREKDDLSPSERKAAAALVRTLKEEAR